MAGYLWGADVARVNKVVDPAADVEETTGLDAQGLLARIRETRRAGA